MNQNKNDINFDEEWEFIMQRGIIKVRNLVKGIDNAHVNLGEYMTLCNKINNICYSNVNYCQELYDRYRKFFEDYIESIVLSCLIEKQDEFMLRELVKRWLNHKGMLRYFCGIFFYLNTYYVSRNSIPTLENIGMDCFRGMVYKKLNGRAVEAVISMINQDREGVKIDKILVKNVVDIFIEVRRIGWYWKYRMDYFKTDTIDYIKTDTTDNIKTDTTDYYESDFEAALLEDTIAYYSLKASKWILEDSCPNYMVKAEECLKREKDMVKCYLPHDTQVKLLKKVEHYLLFLYATHLLENEHYGCHALLRDSKIQDLSRMVRLFSKNYQCLVAFSNIFKQYVTNEGTTLFKKVEEDVNGLVLIGNFQVFVRKLIELHDKYRAYVIGDCFRNHPLFHAALNEIFKVFCNNDTGGCSIAKILAKFCDSIMGNSGGGGGSEKLSHEAVEESMEKVMKLLAFVSDKDIFAKFCWKNLARRLLFGKSSIDEYERSFLSKLKQQYGVTFTTKTKSMVTDFTLCRENQVIFEEYLANFNNPLGGIDLSVTILTDGFWPSYKSFNLNLPTEMVKCVEVFHDFYSTNIKKRKITWIYSLGTCNINGKFEQKTIELIVTTYQASALLLFNDSDKLSYQDIKSQLNMSSDDDVVRLLHSLSCTK